MKVRRNTFFGPSVWWGKGLLVLWFLGPVILTPLVIRREGLVPTLRHAVPPT